MYIALDNIDLSWQNTDVLRVELLWNNGISIPNIARAVKRDKRDVQALILDLMNKRKLKPAEIIPRKKIIPKRQYSLNEACWYLWQMGLGYEAIGKEVWG